MTHQLNLPTLCFLVPIAYPSIKSIKWPTFLERGEGHIVGSKFAVCSSNDGGGRDELHVTVDAEFKLRSPMPDDSKMISNECRQL